MLVAASPVVLGMSLISGVVLKGTVLVSPLFVGCSVAMGGVASLGVAGASAPGSLFVWKTLFFFVF